MVGNPGFEGCGDRPHNVAGKLGAELRHLCSNDVVRGFVEIETLPQPLFTCFIRENDRHKQITGLTVKAAHFMQFFACILVHLQGNTGSSYVYGAT